MGYEGFAFSEETSDLSDAEFERALEVLAMVAKTIELRDRMAEADPHAAKIFLPDEGWHPDSQPSFELDGSTKNAQTSYALLASGDRDIIRKMRLYGHAYTGYQLATLEFAQKRPWLSKKLPDNWDEILSFLAGPPDQSVFDYAAVANALPPELRATPPRKFGEIGWIMDGVIVNDDTYAYLERLCLMAENRLITRLQDRLAQNGNLKIVEIGGGYGGLAYHLLNFFGQKVHYGIIDIPESLAFSGIYLSTMFPDLPAEIATTAEARLNFENPCMSFIPNMIYRETLAGAGPVDLVINTLSLSEMSDAQIKDYCGGVQTLIGNTGLFFEQNHQTDHRGPGGFLVDYFTNLKKCETNILPESFPERRGDANLWVNAGFAE